MLITYYIIKMYVCIIGQLKVIFIHLYTLSIV